MAGGRRRPVMTGLRWVSVAAFTVAIGVSINQVRNDSVWNWWALAIAIVLAIGAAATEHFWNRADGTPPPPPPPPPPADPPAPGPRSAAIGRDNTGIIATGDNVNINQNP